MAHFDHDAMQLNSVSIEKHDTSVGWGMFGWLGRKWRERLLSQQVKMCAAIIDMLKEVRPIFVASRAELTTAYAEVLEQFLDHAHDLSNNWWLGGMGGYAAPPHDRKAIRLRYTQLLRLRHDLRVHAARSQRVAGTAQRAQPPPAAMI